MSDVLDLNMLNELREIMEDDFPSLLETFLSESSRQYQDAAGAWQSSDMDQLRRAAHSLKGSCANIGAQELHQTCSDIEHAAKAGEGEAIPDLLNVADQQLKVVQGEIRNIAH